MPEERPSIADEFLMTTSIREKGITLQGTDIEAPALRLANEPIHVSFNNLNETTETSDTRMLRNSIASFVLASGT